MTSRIGIVHEWFIKRAGSEKVLESLLNLYPEADLYALLDFYRPSERKLLLDKTVKTSFLQHMPLVRRLYRYYLPLMPIAVEQFDLGQHEIIISSSHAVAKGVLVRPDQLHISYVHSPARYVWDLQQSYLKRTSFSQQLFATPIFHYIRLWDLASVNRVNVFVANSSSIAQRIWKTYRRRAHVIHPPVDVDRFNPGRKREEFYLTVSRFVPYKRMDVIIGAFSRIALPLVVIGDGPERTKFRGKLPSNIKLLGEQPDSIIEDYMERCRAFVFAAEEDFGITPVEAQAAGAPVIAYGRGGILDTIVPNQTGLFFEAQTSDALVDALQAFEEVKCTFDAEVIRANAERFRPERFTYRFGQLLDEAWQKFRTGIRR